MLLGSLIGMLAGWYGGRFDVVVMQAMDMLLAFPSLILGLILVAMLGPSMTNIIIAIALTSIPPFARIARAPTIAVKERDYHRGRPRARLLRHAHHGRAHPAQHLPRDPGDGLALARQRDPHRSVARLHRARREAADRDLGRHDPRGLREHPRQLLAGAGSRASRS